MKYSLRKTLTDSSRLPLLLIVIFLPLLASYFFSVSDRYISRREFVVLKQEQDAQAVAAFVHSWLDDAMVLGASVAANTRIDEFRSEGLGEYLKSMADTIPKFEAIFAVDTGGKVYGRAGSLVRKGDVRRVLDVARYSMRSGTTEIVTIYPKREPVSTVVVVYPVRDINHRIVGAVAFLVRMEFLLRDLSSLHEGELGEYVLTDETGKVILSTDRRLTAGKVYTRNGGKRRHLVGAYTIPYIRWTAYATVPLNQVMAPIYTGAVKVLGVIAASLLVALGIVRWFSLRYIKPLRELEDKVNERLVQAQEDERKRLARDIHDWINEHLVGMFYYLQACDADADTNAYEDICTQLKTANTELRRIMNDLHPHLLEEEGLSAACKALVLEFQARTGVVCKLEITVNEQHLSNRHKLTLFRILQEALANVRNHADAKTVFISVTEDDGVINLIVSDDGIGFLSTEVRQGGLGLLSMRERATALNGRLSVISTPGRGTTVESQIPKGGDSANAS